VKPGSYFGDPWPSGICDSGERVETPVGAPCLLCCERIEADHQGSFIYHEGPQPVHKECALRSTIGGIGHVENHVYWCREQHDPDGGRTYRQSALEVWEWVQQHGISGVPT
jgi:hypothetical protein